MEMSVSPAMWGNQPVDMEPFKTVRTSLDNAIAAVFRYTPLRGKTEDLPALILAVQRQALIHLPRDRREEVAFREKMAGIIKYLGRISAREALSFSPDDTPKELQERSQQIDILLIFIARQEAALVAAGASIGEHSDIATLRAKLLEAKRNIAQQCMLLLSSATGVATLASEERGSSLATSSTATEAITGDATTSPRTTVAANGGFGEVPAPVRLSSDEKKILCDILSQSRFAFDDLGKASLVQISQGLARLVHADSSLQKPLSDVQAYVKGKLLNIEVQKDEEESTAALDEVKRILETNDNNDLRFAPEEGAFVAKARHWFRALLERFFGWQGRSKESREAAGLIIAHLGKKSADLASSRSVSDNANYFFNTYLVPLYASRWFQETLKHNPDLRRRLGDVVNETFVHILRTVEIKSSESPNEQLQVLSQLEGKLTAFKGYAAAHGSPETRAGIEALLQRVFHMQQEVLTRALDPYSKRIPTVYADSGCIAFLQGQQQEIAQLLQWVTPRIATACNINVLQGLIASRIATLQSVLDAETSLSSERGYAAQAQNPKTSLETIGDGFNAFMDNLETVYDHLNESEANTRQPAQLDLDVANGICGMLDTLRGNAGRFGAAVGPENYQQFEELTNRFHALQARLAAAVKPATSDAIVTDIHPLLMDGGTVTVVPATSTDSVATTVVTADT